MRAGTLPGARLLMSTQGPLNHRIPHSHRHRPADSPPHAQKSSNAGWSGNSKNSASLPFFTCQTCTLL